MEKSSAQKNSTAVQYIKNTAMGFVVTLLEGLSLNPLIRLFDGTAVTSYFSALAVANTVSILVFFFVRFFLNYFWVFHSRRSIIRILPLFAVLIAMFSYSTTMMIKGLLYLYNLSDFMVQNMSADSITFVAKLIATFAMGIVSFIICKYVIFTEKAENKGKKSKAEDPHKCGENK